jgi:hypothetical protein
MSGPRLLGASGCLSEAGLEALAASTRVPAEVLAHLGKCPRCQERALARSAGYARDAPRTKKQPPPLWRTLVVVLAAVLLVASALMMLSRVRQ